MGNRIESEGCSCGPFADDLPTNEIARGFKDLQQMGKPPREPPPYIPYPFEVVNGFTQIEGLNLHKIFALIEKIVTVYRSYYLEEVEHALQGHNAFLHGDLHEDYMTLPLGFSSANVFSIA
ncbi:hypothetical protein CRG98_017297 [Punica granatum]|uniref:Uncharacterized protein n=1 Tax=Punica granatum TaxID=22663 RepID=A0A2I0K3L4_PUNGR|nr:hypothetical protein CRG98_017297 [Punica granatum]